MVISKNQIFFDTGTFKESDRGSSDRMRIHVGLICYGTLIQCGFISVCKDFGI